MRGFENSIHVSTWPEDLVLELWLSLVSALLFLDPSWIWEFGEVGAMGEVGALVRSAPRRIKQSLRPETQPAIHRANFDEE